MFPLLIFSSISIFLEQVNVWLFGCPLFILHFQFFFQMRFDGFKKWLSSYWNIGDAVAIVLFFVGFGLRMGGLLIEGRITYALDLMVFILRILEIFYVDRTLGPYVVMIGRMVNSINTGIFCGQEVFLHGCFVNKYSRKKIFRFPEKNTCGRILSSKFARSNTYVVRKFSSFFHCKKFSEHLLATASKRFITFIEILQS